MNGGKIAALEYEVDEKLLSFRRKITKQNLTDEQREAIRQRLNGKK